eukprot:5830653-Ditylum_brightwellii.AAC.1
MYQPCNSLDCQWSLVDSIGLDCQWSLVKINVMIKIIGHHTKDGTMLKAEKEKCVSGRRNECNLKRVVKKCEQMIINCYFDEEDVEVDE